MENTFTDLATHTLTLIESNLYIKNYFKLHIKHIVKNFFFFIQRYLANTFLTGNNTTVVYNSILEFSNLKIKIDNKTAWTSTFYLSIYFMNALYFYLYCYYLFKAPATFYVVCKFFIKVFYSNMVELFFFFFVFSLVMQVKFMTNKLIQNFCFCKIYNFVMCQNVEWVWN